MSFAICNGEGHAAVGPHCPLLLYAGSGDYAMQAEQDAGGFYVTHRRFDGVIDTTGFDDADCDDEPYCVDCGTYVDHWDHAS